MTGPRIRSHVLPTGEAAYVPQTAPPSKPEIEPTPPSRFPLADGKPEPEPDNPHTVERALLSLAGMCDGARAQDGVGFNGADTDFGHSLAERVNIGALTGKQKRAAYRMLRKYAGQLRSYGIDYAKIPDPTEEAPEAVDRRAAVEASTKRNKAWVEKGRIWTKTEFKLKDAIKEIPGRRWHGESKCWHFPESPSSALAVRDLLSRHGAEYDDAFLALIAAAEQQRAAAVHKDAEDLPDVPIRGQFSAWQHQRQAFWFAMAQDACALDMGMGTGKSRVTVDLLQNREAKRVIVVCPPKVVGVWPREFRKHAHPDRPWHVEDGRRRVERGKNKGKLVMMGVADRVQAFEHALYECRCGRPHAVILNYEATAHEPMKTWQPQGIDYLVMDEAQKIVAPNGVWSKWCARVGKLAQRRLVTTGTLLPQTPLDAFGVFRALDPGIFGTSNTAFKRRYAIMGGYGGYEVLGLQREEELAQKIASITYRVGSEVLDLPPTREVTRSCQIGAEAAKAYRALEDGMWAELDAGEITAANVLVKMLRLQQITGGAVNTDEGVTVEIDTAKADLFADVLEEIGQRRDDRGFPAVRDDGTKDWEPVVVFCRFVHDLDAVQREAEKAGRVYREISGRRSDGLTEDATMAEDADVVGVQIQSGGAGVDLTRAAHAVYYSLGFSLSDYEQSLKRLDRPGQTRSVLFTHLVAEGTIDEQVYDALAARKAVIDHVLSLAGRAPTEGDGEAA